MTLCLTAPTPLEYFASLVSSDEGFPLLEAAASIAQDESPQLDIQQVLAEVDHLMWRLRRRVPADAPGVHKLRLLNQFFYGTLGFEGNVNHYHAPENSYLNEVLRTRRGIPVSLAVLWLELAQGLGLNVQGVAFPGHFLVRALVPEGQIVVDPFTGKSLSRKELMERLSAWPQEAQSLERDAARLNRHLQASTPRNIIARMLRNLKELHRMQGDWGRALAVLERLVVLLPEDWEQRRDRGLAYAYCGHAAEALADLQGYLAQCPRAPDASAIAECIHGLQQAG